MKFVEQSNESMIYLGKFTFYTSYGFSCINCLPLTNKVLTGEWCQKSNAIFDT